MADATPSLWQYSSPDAYRIAQQKAMQEAADAYAAKTQQQRTDAAGYMAGAGLRQGLNSLFGVEDKGLQQVKQFQEIMKGVDRQNPEALFGAAKKLQDIGHPAFDSVVAAGEKAVELNKKRAEAKRANAMAEGYGQNFEAMRMMEIINDPESTPAQIEQAQKRLDALNEKAKGSKSGGGVVRTYDIAGIGKVEFNPGAEAGKRWTRPNGQPLTEQEQLIASQYDPATVGAVAGAKAGSTAVGKGAGEAQLALPKVEFQTAQTNTHLDELLAHPGFKSAVGATWKPGAKYVQGSQEASFQSRYNQLKGESFNMAYETLRGGGSITENETKQAGAALNRMDTASSEEEFRAAAEDFRKAVNAGLAIMRKKASMSFTTPTAPQQQVPVVQTPSTPESIKYPFKLTLNTREEVKAAYQAGKFGPVNSPEALHAANTILNQIGSK